MLHHDAGHASWVTGPAAGKTRLRNNLRRNMGRDGRAATNRYLRSMPPTPHHRAGGGFENPWPGSEERGFRDLLRWRRERRARTRHEPARDAAPALPVVESGYDRPRAAPTVLTATWIGHSTALLQLGGMNVLTDPMWSRRASPVPWAGPARLVPPPVALDALPPIDLVLISHNHYDHLDRRTVQRLARQEPQAEWLAPVGLTGILRRWGVRNPRELDWWDRTAIGQATVSCVPARHFSSRTPWDRNRTLWAGWTIAANGWRVYFAGDTAYHPAFGQIAATAGPFDLVLLPVGAYEPRWFMGSVHMNPEDALAAYHDLRAAHPAAQAPCFLPIHWGTFSLTDEPVAEPPARTLARWTDAGLPRDALWLLAHGETRRRERRG